MGRIILRHIGVCMNSVSGIILPHSFRYWFYLAISISLLKIEKTVEIQSGILIILDDWIKPLNPYLYVYIYTHICLCVYMSLKYICIFLRLVEV